MTEIIVRLVLVLAVAIPVGFAIVWLVSLAAECRRAWALRHLGDVKEADFFGPVTYPTEDQVVARAAAKECCNQIKEEY